MEEKNVEEEKKLKNQRDLGERTNYPVILIRIPKLISIKNLAFFLVSIAATTLIAEQTVNNQPTEMFQIRFPRNY